MSPACCSPGPPPVKRNLRIRATLGASRFRLVRQLLIESFLLASAGAVLGCVMASAGLSALIAVIPENILPEEAVIQMNAPVLLFALGVAILPPSFSVWLPPCKFPAAI